ncbi:type VI secretion system Vgr family protein [Sorangium sp. So ce117]|uniref:type VI secretion system Vgr family protein n=1 Tax=Sorangium sp. So ce117 TaxID=3133277 RepID=UPI003F5EEE63
MDQLSVTSGLLAQVSWTPLSCVGEEAISSLFWFSVVISAPMAEIEDALGSPLALSVERALAGESVRFRLGEEGLWRTAIVAEATVEGIRESEPFPLTVRLRLVPRMWLLNHRKNTRIFQDKYLDEIVGEVLVRYRIRHRWDLRNSYRKRLYCTQYEETDYEFVTRVFAEEGVLFFFEHPQDDWEPDEPEQERGTSRAKRRWEMALNIAEGASKFASMIGGGSVVKAAGQIGLALTDLAKSKERDDEDDSPRTIGAGAGGLDGTGEILVFVDQASYLEPAVGLTLLSIEGAVPDRSGIQGFTSNASVAPMRAEVRDYDFRRPLLALAKADGDDSARHNGAGLPLEGYWHHGDLDKPNVDAETAQVHREQYRARVEVSSARSLNDRLVAGGTIALRNATAVPVAHGSFAIVRIRHESYLPNAAASSPAPGSADALVAGCAEAFQEALERGERLSQSAVRDLLRRALSNPISTPPTYQNRFECVPIDVPYRPPRPKRVMLTTTESATVVGPSKQTGGSGQEIYLDKYGRVKVQFHWDRDGKWDEHSSAWIRVAQAWAGAGFGFQFLPRVGMEVLVAYIGGDPDRPVVVGALYNATHPTPEPLPERMTRSGIRTQSSPGGGGFNEISFEDAKGSERIYMHAEKDLDQVVNDAHVLNVAGKQTVLVGDARQVTVGGDERATVQGDRSTTLGGADTSVVKGSRTARVNVNETVNVGGHDARNVGGLSIQRVGADALAVVEGDYNLSVHKDAITQVGGAGTTDKSNAITFVQGSSYLTATDKIVVKAGDLVVGQDQGDASPSTIRLECGASSIVLTKDSITIAAPTVTVAGSDTVQLVRAASSRPSPPPPPKVFKLNADEARLFSDVIHLETGSAKLALDHASAALTGNAQAEIVSPVIKLRSGATSGTVTAPGGSADRLQTAEIQLAFSYMQRRDGGTPIQNTVCRIVVGEKVIERVTDASGVAAFHVPKAAKTASISLFANERPEYSDYFPAERGSLHWLLHLGDPMPDAMTTRGALMRLANLGYAPSTDLPEEPSAGAASGGTEAEQALDDVSREAVRQFRADSEMELSDSLDREVHEEIQDIYGS